MHLYFDAARLVIRERLAVERATGLAVDATAPGVCGRLQGFLVGGETLNVAYWRSRLQRGSTWRPVPHRLVIRERTGTISCARHSEPIGYRSHAARRSECYYDPYILQLTVKPIKPTQRPEREMCPLSGCPKETTRLPARLRTKRRACVYCI